MPQTLFMGPHGLFAVFHTLFRVIEPLVFVDILSLQHQKAPSLGLIGGAVSSGTGKQGTEAQQNKANKNHSVQYFEQGKTVKMSDYANGSICIRNHVRVWLSLLTSPGVEWLHSGRMVIVLKKTQPLADLSYPFTGHEFMAEHRRVDPVPDPVVYWGIQGGLFK